MNKSNPKAELFEAFESLSRAIPSMRAGQLVAAVGELCSDLHGRGLWDAEDKELLEAIWQFQRNLESSAAGQGQNPPNPFMASLVKRQGGSGETLRSLDEV